MSIFDGLPIPWAGDRQNSSASQALTSGYNAATARESVELQRQSRVDALKFRENQMKAQMQASKELVDSMRAFGVEDEEGMSRFLVQNPGAALSPYTAPLVKNLAGAFSNMTRTQLAAKAAEAKTYEGKIQTEDALSFAKDMYEVGPLYRSKIREMEPPDQQGSANQLEALGIIKERLKAEKNSVVEPKPFSVTTPSGNVVEGVFNPKTGHFTTPKPQTSVEEQVSKKKLTELHSLDTKYADQLGKLQQEYASEQSTLKSGDEENRNMKGIRAKILTLEKQRSGLQDQIKSFQSAPAPATPVNVPQAHIDYLKQNPTEKVVSDFEEKYGTNSASQYLK